MHHNNFNILRLLAALSVVFSHTFTFYKNAHDPVHTLTGMYASTLGLVIFFTISGFLITKSLLNSAHLGQYFIKRFLRILPALYVSTFITMFIIAPLLAPFDLKTYFTDPLCWKYLQVLFVFRAVQPLPGVGILNGALWSIALEIKLYIVLAFLYFITQKIPKIKVKWLILSVFCVLFILKILVVTTLTLADSYTNTLNFSTLFMLGSTVSVFPTILSFHKKYVSSVAAFLCVFCCFFDCLEIPALMLALPYLVLQIGLVRSKTGDFLTQTGDFSYGIYVYALPLQHLLVYFINIENIEPLAFFALILLILLPFAAFSWFFIEKPALNLKTKF
jgi:peptidoglycan/LPS O-acetylase OafA/YrhL